MPPPPFLSPYFKISVIKEYVGADRGGFVLFTVSAVPASDSLSRYPDELLQYLRLIQLNRDQLRGKTLEDLMFEKKQTDVNELMVLDSLIEACNTALEGYPTTASAVRPVSLECLS